MAIIYQILNTENQKMFIGYTSKKTPEQALKYWMNNCSKKVFAEYEIAKDVKKYGKQVFTVRPIADAASDGEAQEITDNFIIQYDTLEPNGYNKNFVGIRKRNPDYYEKN